MTAMESSESQSPRKPIFRDIRRYYCDFCGICRSKKTLIAAHILSHHKDKVQEAECNGDGKNDGPKKYSCEECGACFKKPAYLKQHMQGHSNERPFSCPVDDCSSCYRRKDHLTRHSLSHQGKLFTCPVEGCGRKFTLPSNMKRHVTELHDEDTSENDTPQLYTCSEVGCGKTFKYMSKLKRHENSHVKLDSIEIICCEPGCMKHFSNNECLKAHTQSCHRYINCSECGTSQLKKNLKRHMRTHEEGIAPETFKCSFSDCQHEFTKKSNLYQHVKAAHLEERPFSCRFADCGKRFSFKHVRDNHEKSGIHVHAHGDFLAADEQFRLRNRGGRKREHIDVGTLFRKRVAAPSDCSVLDDAQEYMRWMLGEDS